MTLLSLRDSAELARSASEASKTKLLLTESDLHRYLDPPASTPYPLEYAFHLLGDIRGQVVLDLGCGSGENLMPLRRRGAHVIGVDLSPELLTWAAKRCYSEGCALLLASAYETGLPAHSVDVIFCVALLHHLEIPRAMQEIHRALKPEGRLIVSEPIRFSPALRRLRKLLPQQEDVSEFEYPLNEQQWRDISKGFARITERRFRLPCMALLKKHKWAWKLDAALLRTFPRLEHFATVRVAEMRKIA